jgi:hypothetical protein
MGTRILLSLNIEFAHVKRWYCSLPELKTHVAVRPAGDEHLPGQSLHIFASGCWRCAPLTANLRLGRT